MWEEAALMSSWCLSLNIRGYQRGFYGFMVIYKCTHAHAWFDTHQWHCRPTHVIDMKSQIHKERIVFASDSLVQIHEHIIILWITIIVIYSLCLVERLCLSHKWLLFITLSSQQSAKHSAWPRADISESRIVVHDQDV